MIEKCRNIVKSIFSGAAVITPHTPSNAVVIIRKFNKVGGSAPAPKSKCAAGKLSDTKIGDRHKRSSISKDLTTASRAKCMSAAVPSKSNSRKLPRPSAKNLTIEHIREMYGDWIQQGQNVENQASKCIATINLNSDKLERLVHENNELAQLRYKCPMKDKYEWFLQFLPCLSVIMFSGLEAKGNDKKNQRCCICPLSPTSTHLLDEFLFPKESRCTACPRSLSPKEFFEHITKTHNNADNGMLVKLVMAVQKCLYPTYDPDETTKKTASCHCCNMTYIDSDSGNCPSCWSCSNCTLLNKTEALICTACHEIRRKTVPHTKPEQNTGVTSSRRSNKCPSRWRCLWCTFLNAEEKTACVICSKSRGTAPEPREEHELVSSLL
jgi:hypothetical protein